MSDIERSKMTNRDLVQALQSSRLLNPDLTLRGIVQAAQQIPGLNDGSPISWELITRDFVYRGLPESGERVSDQDIVALQESSVINFDITAKEILSMSQQFPGLAGGGGSPVAWELISRDFILRGMPAFDEPGQIGNK